MTDPDNPFELTDDEVVKLTMAFIHGSGGSAYEVDITAMLEKAQSWKIDKCFFDAAIAGVAYLKLEDDGDYALVANLEWPNVPDYSKPNPAVA